MSTKNIYLKATSELKINDAKSRKYPIVTVVTKLVGDEVEYSLSICSPEDDFVKKVGIELATTKPVFRGRTKWTDVMVETYGMNKAISLAVTQDIRTNLRGMSKNLKQVLDDNILRFKRQPNETTIAALEEPVDGKSYDSVEELMEDIQ